MPDKKLTDNEIIKALECCNKNDCRECPYGKYNTAGWCCMPKVRKDAIDLINHLQAENDKTDRAFENLIEVARHWKEKYSNAKKELFDKTNQLKIAKAENERLSKEVDRLSQVVLYNDSITEMKVEEAETKAYKEFAERLCEGRVSNDNTVILAKCLLKELVGDK